jgi:hypothetical protein
MAVSLFIQCEGLVHAGLDIIERANLKDVLPKPGQWHVNRVAELTAMAWKAARKQSRLNSE